MTIQNELLTVLNQIPAAIEKAFYGALVLRHPGHGNQKTHGNRFGAGQAKESLRRLKDDKGAREKYKESHRARNKGASQLSSYSDYKKNAEGKIESARQAIGKTKKRSLLTGNLASQGRHYEQADNALREARNAVVKRVDIKSLTDTQFKDFQRIGSNYNRLLTAFDKKRSS